MPSPLNPENRPNPDALLATAQQEQRGKLKIFLGAAPGVGKTYAMLQAAQQKFKDGVNVVVGVVETHGRAETSALLQGLPVIPQQIISYRGLSFQELDTQALLDSKADLALVDELAHTNVPGSRHEKRYQDIAELIDAGIDVYTTLNIQHLESLNDVIAQITGVRVRETLPDNVLAMADTIKLIDLPPDELIQRLKDGKIYMEEQAKRAIASFFTTGNLTALRELALRTAAERVDTQMINYMQAHAVSGTWPTRERILVCINNDVIAPRLVRLAKRTADRRKAPWIALLVQKPNDGDIGQHANQALRIAEELGGEAITLVHDDIASEILRFANTRNVSTIIVGKWRRPKWISIFAPSISEQILHVTDNIDVLVVDRDPDGDQDTTQKQKTTPTSLIPLSFFSASRKDYAMAVLVSLLSGAMAYGINMLAPTAPLAVLFLTAVLMVALNIGFGPGLLSALISFGLYDGFILGTAPPTTPNAEFGLATLPFFLIVAFIAGRAQHQKQVQLQSTLRSAQRTQNLYEFNRKIAAAASLDDVCWAVCHHVAISLESKTIVMLPDDSQNLKIAAGFITLSQLDHASLGAADWAFHHSKVAGHATHTLPAADWLFWPLITKRGCIGLIGIDDKGRHLAKQTEPLRLLESLSDQAATAIERTLLAHEYEESRTAMTANQLRSELLTNIASDLRIPIASMRANLRSLNTSQTLGEAEREKILLSLQKTSEQLNRFIQNLNDVIKLDAGDVTLKKETIALPILIRAVLERMKPQMGGRKVITIIPDTIPDVSIDFALMELVFIHILENVTKYTPPFTPVDITARQKNSHVYIEIRDQGPGIPTSELTRIFDVFYRVHDKNSCSMTSGTGLGLAICKGIVNAHGGTISARNNPDNMGTTLVVELPIAGAD